MKPQGVTSNQIIVERESLSLSETEMPPLSLGLELRSNPRGCGIFASGYMPSREFESVAIEHLDLLRKKNTPCIVSANRTSSYARMVSDLKQEGIQISFYLVDSLAGVLSENKVLESARFMNAVTGIYSREQRAIYLDRTAFVKMDATSKSILKKDLIAISRLEQLEVPSGQYVSQLWNRISSKQESMAVLFRTAKPLIPMSISVSAQNAAISPADLEKALTRREDRRDLAISAIFYQVNQLIKDSEPLATLILEPSLSTPFLYRPTSREFLMSTTLFTLNGEELTALFRFAKKYQLLIADQVSNDDIENLRSFAIEFSYDLLINPSQTRTKSFISTLQSVFLKLDVGVGEESIFVNQLLKSILQLATDPNFYKEIPSVSTAKLDKLTKALEKEITRLKSDSLESEQTLVQILIDSLTALSSGSGVKNLSSKSLSRFKQIKESVDLEIDERKYLTSSNDRHLNRILSHVSSTLPTSKYTKADPETSAERLKITKQRYRFLFDRLAQTEPEFWSKLNIKKGISLDSLQPSLSDIANINKTNEKFELLDTLKDLENVPSSLLESRAKKVRIRTGRKTQGGSARFSPIRFELEALGADLSKLSIPNEIQSISLLLRELVPQLGSSLKLAPLSAYAMQVFSREWLVKCEHTLLLSSSNGEFNNLANKLLTSAIAMSLGKDSQGDVSAVARLNSDPILFSRVKAILVEQLLHYPFSSKKYEGCISPQAKTVVKMASSAWEVVLDLIMDGGLFDLAYFPRTDEQHTSRVQYIYSHWKSQFYLKAEVDKIEINEIQYGRKPSLHMQEYLGLVSKELLPYTDNLIRYCVEIMKQSGHLVFNASLSPELLDSERRCWQIVLRYIATSTDESSLNQVACDAVRAALSNVAGLNLPSRQIAAQLFSDYLSVVGNDFAAALVLAWINVLYVEGLAHDHDMAIGESSVLRRIDSLPLDYAQKISLHWLSSPDKITTLLKSNLNRTLKVFLLNNCPREPLEKALQGVDTDVIRQYFKEFSILEALQITKDTMDPHARSAITQREVYENAIEDMPFSLDSVVREEELPNYFAILGVPRSSLPAIIKKSYRMLALVYHPDLFAQESEDARNDAKERTRQLAEAYEVLLNPELLSNYLRAIPNRSSFYPKEAWFSSLPRSR